MAGTKGTALTTQSVMHTDDWLLSINTHDTTSMPPSSAANNKVSPAVLLAGMMGSTNGILKANGSGVVSAATSGTDYYAPGSAISTSDVPSLAASKITSGSLATARGGLGLDASAATTGQIPKANGSGGFSLATIGLSDLPTLATLNVLANTTGGTAAPAGVTLSGLIDASYGSTRGSILYRGSSGWAELSPGTSGYALTSQGSGADPVYAVGGTVRTLFNAKNLTAVANTTTATTLLAGGTVFNGTQVSGGCTFPTALLQAGAYIETMGLGNYGSTASSPTLKFVFALNGTTVMQGPAVTVTTTNTATAWLTNTNHPKIYIQTLSGASSSVLGHGQITQAGSSTFTHWLEADGAQSSSGTYAPVTVDLTNSTTTLNWTATWSAASASNTISMSQVVIRLVLPA